MSSKIEKRRTCWDDQYMTVTEKDTNPEQKPADFRKIDASKRPMDV